METRANYVLIGAFTVAGFVGIFAFLFWFANIQLDRQFAYYDVNFTSVSGLSDASDVRFSGLPVGRVVSVRLSPERDGRVQVRVEVDADTPIRVDSVATIEAQGVTGVSFVGISAGRPDSPLLNTVSEDEVPVILEGQSILQSLSRDAPEILSQTLEVVRALRSLIGDENQDRVQTILENVEASSGAFSQTLEDFSLVTSSVSGFATQIDRFNETLATLTTDASGVMTAMQTTLGSIDTLATDARDVLAQGTETLARASTTITSADRYITEDLSAATGQLTGAVADFERRFEDLSQQAEALMATYIETGRVATERISDVRATLAATNALIARMETAVGNVDNAAQRFDGLIADEAVPLLAELRSATAEATSVLQTIGATAQTDLPAILGDVRSAADRAAQAVETVAQDLTAASGQFNDLASGAGATLDAARLTFANANETLAALNGALATGDQALIAAESAFRGADRVINEEAATIAAQLRATLAELERTVGSVAEDIPGVAQDLRSASRSAEAAFAEIARAVDQSAPAVRDFAATALPQYSRLATETRTLINNLDALVAQIRREPSRFFLAPRAPEYNR